MNPANTNDLCANKLQKAAFALLLTVLCFCTCTAIPEELLHSLEVTAQLLAKDNPTARSPACADVLWDPGLSLGIIIPRPKGLSSNITQPLPSSLPFPIPPLCLSSSLHNHSGNIIVQVVWGKCGGKKAQAGIFREHAERQN